MNAEGKYLLIFMAWMGLWWVAPWLAFPLMLFMVAKHFRDIRRQRLAMAYAAQLHAGDKRWAEMEGFQECVQATDAADWWKDGE